MLNLMTTALTDPTRTGYRANREVEILCAADRLVSFAQQSVLDASFSSALLQALQRFFPSKEIR